MSIHADAARSRIRPAAAEGGSALVEELLRKGLDHKLMVAGMKQALAYLEEAHRVARNLGGPWRHITAYRLAHLRLRLAMS
jgi:hypothetical protein